MSPLGIQPGAREKDNTDALQGGETPSVPGLSGMANVT